jgi:hypothetical protein
MRFPDGKSQNKARDFHQDAENEDLGLVEESAPPVGKLQNKARDIHQDAENEELDLVEESAPPDGKSQNKARDFHQDAENEEPGLVEESAPPERKISNGTLWRGSAPSETENEPTISVTVRKPEMREHRTLQVIASPPEGIRKKTFG